MTEVKKRWYVVRSVSGQELKVKDYIEREISHLGMGDYVSQVLVPLEKVYQVRNGKKVVKERNFYPGYVLIEAALVGEVPHVIKAVTNVIGFLGGEKGGDPMPMRISEVNRILGKVDELSEHEEEMSIPFVVGETVNIFLEGIVPLHGNFYRNPVFSLASEMENPVYRSFVGIKVLNKCPQTTVVLKNLFFTTALIV